MEHMGGVRLRMDYQLADGYGCSAAFGPQLIKCPCPVAGHTVGSDVRRADGGGKHAVAEGDIAQGDGL